MMDPDGTERSISDMYCVVYRLEKKKWVTCGKGWSQIHLYLDSADGTHRIVGWTVSDYQVILNVNINDKCLYKKKSADFHKLVTGSKSVFGFGFYNKKESLEEANSFLKEINTAIGKGVRDNSEIQAAQQARHSKINPDLHTMFEKSSPLKTYGVSSKSVKKVIRQLSATQLTDKKSFRKFSVQSPTEANSDASELLHKEVNINLDRLWDRDLRAFKMGPLEILPARKKFSKPKRVGSHTVPPPPPARRQTYSVTNAVKTTAKNQSQNYNDKEHKVTGVDHQVHVKFDPVTRRYTGLPKEWGWEKNLQRQFGLGPKAVECQRVEGYKSRIPHVLIQMKEYLFNNGGLQSEGIFRLAPDQEECSRVKKQLDSASFESCSDINVIANLIKVWLREMPERLLTGANPIAMQDCKNEKEALDIISTISEPNQSILLWLLDMMIEVSEFHSENKMSPQNLAIVMAPNLFSSDDLNPMAALVYSQKVAVFVFKSIKGRITEREQRKK
mmetsp:Transcript_21586/g.52845  ORF Transcript_21586/g.52845 Transcript_21586/m.52845 type:complete len:501 (-) Transcript_21586:350-1852(-)